MRLTAFIIALPIAIAGCSGCRKKSTPSAPPPPKAEAPSAPASPQLEAEAVEIEPLHIALSVHASANIELGSGWGWVIDASVLDRDALQPDAGASRLPRPDGGGPSSSFSLELTRADGTKVPLKAVPAAPPPADPEGSSEGETIAEARWLVAPEDTGLAPGKYELVASLEAPAFADAGWGGRTTGGPVRITIAAPPSPVTPAWVEQEKLVKAHYAQAKGDLAGARAEIDALLVAQPENVAALSAKGDLQDAANDKAGALETFEQALSILAKSNEDREEPPVYLLQRRRELALALGKH